MDLGEKDAGEGGAQADVVEPVAQRDRRRAARVEGQRLRCAQGRSRARRRLEGNGTDERRGGLRPPVPGPRPNPGPVYPDPDWDAVHAELAKVGATFRFLHGEYREDAPLGARRPCPTAAFASGTGSSRSAGRL